MATEKQIKGFFAFAIQQNKTKVVSNLNANNYQTPLNISNQDLVDKLYSIYLQKGSDEISKLIEGVNVSTVSQADLRAIRASLTGQTPQDVANQKTFLQTLQEVWAGVTSTTGESTTETSQPAINPILAAFVVLVIAAIIGVIAFKA